MPRKGYQTVTIDEEAKKQLKEIAKKDKKSESDVAEELINEEHKKISDED